MCALAKTFLHQPLAAMQTARKGQNYLSIHSRQWKGPTLTMGQHTTQILSEYRRCRDTAVPAVQVCPNLAVVALSLCTPVSLTHDQRMQGCRGALVQAYRNTGLQEYRVIGIQGYRNTGSQEYRVTGTQGHRNTGLQEYRVTGIQGYRNTGLREYRVAVVDAGSTRLRQLQEYLAASAALPLSSSGRQCGRSIIDHRRCRRNNVLQRIAADRTVATTLIVSCVRGCVRACIRVCMCA